VAKINEPSASQVSITNTTTIAGAQFDPDSSNNNSSATFTTTPSADLAISKTVSNSNQLNGSEITFTIIATDTGPSNATGVKVTDALPGDLTLISATPSVGTYDNATGIWTIGNINNGGTDTLTIVAKINEPSSSQVSITNTATITGDQFDPSAIN